MRWIITLVIPLSLAAQAPRSADYEAVQNRLARGWNTWDVHSVTAQVLLPEGFTIRVGLKHNSSLNSDAFLSDALIGRQGQGVELVFPGPHTWNGSYTRLRLAWRDHVFVLETAHDGDDLVMLATPTGSKSALQPTLVFSAGVLWNRSGSVSRVDGIIEFRGGAAAHPLVHNRERGGSFFHTGRRSILRGELHGACRAQHWTSANTGTDQSRARSPAA